MNNSSLVPSDQDQNHRLRIEVRDFTRPGDTDSAEGIRRAIMTAQKTGATEIIFEQGRYFLRSTVTHATEGMCHDAGSPHTIEKECHIVIDGVADLCLSGAVDAQGHPATVLAGWNDQTNHRYLPAILWCEHCPGLSINNLAFTRDPAFGSCGRIVEVTEDSIAVEVYPDCPAWDGMGAYCANRFSPDGSTLVGESLTYGNGAEAVWREIGEHKLRLQSPALAARVRKGDQMSWHQGAKTDFQTYLAHCDHLQLDNLRTLNSNGFCMLTENCRNITARSVHFEPPTQHLFTGPRDGWKLFRCSGHIEVSDLSVRGVRMDGQNMQSNWLHLTQIIGPKEALFFCKYVYTPIHSGSFIEFYRGAIKHLCPITSAELEGRAETGKNGHFYRVRFAEAIPSFAELGALCAASCWEADQYICRNSYFHNIAGAGHLIRFDNVLLQGNRYHNTMNPGVLLGAELPTHEEGGHATNIRIESCEFDNCGFFPRYQTEGCIGIHSVGFNLPVNREIVITNNLFRNAAKAVDVKTASQVRISGNSYEHIGQVLQVDPATTERIDGSQ